MRSTRNCCITSTCIISSDILIRDLDRVTAHTLAVYSWSLGTNSSGSRLIASNPGHSSLGTDSTPLCRCNASLASCSALWFQPRFTWSIPWEGHDWSLFRALARSGDNPAALHSISPRICRTTRLESPQMISRRRSKESSNSKPNSIHSYLASFTMETVRCFKAALTTDHAGRLHTTALKDPLSFLPEPNRQNSLHIAFRVSPKWA